MVSDQPKKTHRRDTLKITTEYLENNCMEHLWASLLVHKTSIEKNNINARFELQGKLYWAGKSRVKAFVGLIMLVN